MTGGRSLHASPYRDFTYPRATPFAAAGGSFKPRPETFAVTEVPLYPFCGSGEHAIVVVEKRDRTTRDLATAVARRLDLPATAIGYAGMKDKGARATQAFSVRGVETQAAAAAFANEDGVQVLEATRHRNKLRLGHLAGNRFRLEVLGADLGRARQALAFLALHGLPNYYGPQRFGARGDNAQQGLQVLRGARRVKRWQRDLLVSALQAFVFNEVLARRVEAGDWERPVAGDVLRRADSGGLFVCEDPAADAPRAASLEVSPTGPIFGRKMRAAAGQVQTLEGEVLGELGLTEAMFGRATGTRRPLRVPVTEADAQPCTAGVELCFTLPAGSFATVLVDEICGAECPAP